MKSKNPLKIQKSKKISQPTGTQKLLTVVRQPETWLGAVILGALLILAFNSFFPKNISENTFYPSATPTAIILNSLSPEATNSATASSSAFTPASAEATQSAMTNISTESATLTDTSVASPAAEKAPLKVVVKPNQTFWELASRYCNDHNLAEKLAQDNGYASVSKLKTGDVITITCAQ